MNPILGATTCSVNRTILGILFVALILLGAGCGASGEKTGLAPDVIAAMNRGVACMGQYQYDQAVQAFQKVLSAQPGMVDAKINLAISLFNRNRKEDADLDNGMRLLNELLQAEPGNPRVLYFKGIILQHLGQTEEAIACFEQVVQKKPQDGAAWYLLGLCKQRVGKPASEELLRALQHKPYLYSAHYKLAQIALGEDNKEKAKEYLDRFNKLRESPLGESIELPQYNQMGDLALVLPFPVQPGKPISHARFQASPPRIVFEHPESLLWAVEKPALETSPNAIHPFGGAAVGDLNRDGQLDLVLTAADSNAPGRLILLLGEASGSFRNATAGSGLESVRRSLACALGDYDNDEKPDLFVACAGVNHLFKGNGDGTFSNVTQPSGTGGAEVVSPFAMFLDADHDGDLDILVCNTGPLQASGTAPNQLLNNNGDGTFTDVAAQAGIACADSLCVGAVTGDIDEDRDLDLILFRQDKPARIFLNELLGAYREAEVTGLEIRGDRGAVLQDFNGDGALDLLALGGSPPALRLFLGDRRGQFQHSEPFDEYAKSAASWGPLRAFRVADVDLDADLDVAVFADEGHLLLNDGTGRFVLQSRIWSASQGQRLLGADLFDFNRDYVPDLFAVEEGPAHRVILSTGALSLPPRGFTIQPTGVRSRDGRTRSPASGYGVKATARMGLQEQTLLYTGLWGGPNQSLAPLSFGLDGASKADYVSLLWPDGVTQVEMGLAAGQSHVVPETQRKMSSCPVLFAWNGERFAFVTDFAGIGGLGYFAAPGETTPPQVLEHVKIEAAQLQPKDAYYELRVCEPMEESAYIDRVELLAVDHPATEYVFPDERLAIGGPPPTHELLRIEKPLFPVQARDFAGRDCTDKIARIDRIYAYDPPLDRRYIGFCQPHTLELDFGAQLTQFGPQDKVFLFLHGFLEYPYSQTVYAARQSRVGWEPIRIEALDTDGRWRVIVPDGGAPGGMGRMWTIELTGKLDPTSHKLRLTTNLELFYDQIFIARHAGLDRVRVHHPALSQATLRRVGFAREYSPDGRLPLLYDYDLSDPTAPFQVLKGAYTRYGPVEKLLASFDDRFVLMGPGDEIVLRFDASALPALAAGQARSFVLISHAYCKDMDLYTATPQTLEPLPFRAMSRYPYPTTERYPDTPEHQTYLRGYNTRRVE